MKKTTTFTGLTGLCCTLAGCSNQGNLGSVLLIVLGLILVGMAGIRTYGWMQYIRRRRRNSRRKPRGLDIATYCLYALGALLLIGGLLCSCTEQAPNITNNPGTSETTGEPGNSDAVSKFSPIRTQGSDPANWNIRWEIFENGKIAHTYNREKPITFGAPDDYFALPGIAAFRGNNYRDSATYGTAQVTEKALTKAWTVPSTALPGGIWEGSGWTGQPLVVQWDAETKASMNLYESKKAKTDLVEVIYATLDGHIYFLDLADGTPTRDAINMGMCFKGSGSLDPRGYPLLYVGAGDENIEGKRPRMFIISLIDGKVLYEYGHEDNLSYRKDNDRWCAFDSSPLVDAETDTLIWPGENGLLYTIRLNTSYNKAAGTLSIAPETPVLTRYLTGRTSYDAYWFGYEASANIVENYLYVSENGGLFYCVDLNTMELIWAQDTKDDSNSSPVFQRVSDTQGYIYTAPSLHWTRNADMQGSISIYKLDAVTGEILWEKPYAVHTVDGISGGVQSTPLLGEAGTNLEKLIIYTIARTPEKETGVIVALDTATGEAVWSMDMAYYTWSSPVAVYTPDGIGYIIVCDTAGNAMLVNGADGNVLNTLHIGGLIEASPVVFNDMLVVGTRGKEICGIRIS